MATHKVVTHEWLTARKKHLAKEKEFTRLRDQLSKERRDLPWELVENEYIFEGENGRHTLGEVFDGRSQLAEAPARPRLETVPTFPTVPRAGRGGRNRRLPPHSPRHSTETQTDPLA